MPLYIGIIQSYTASANEMFQMSPLIEGFVQFILQIQEFVLYYL